MKRKSKLMLSVESQMGETLEAALPRILTDEGLVESAARVGVSKATLSYWALKLDIEFVGVWLGPDASLVLTRADGDGRLYGRETR